jgi:hypothetical protein
MIELTDDALVFSFPEVHPEARFTLHFQRTLRIPDNGRTYPLPAGLGRFPLRHVDDFASRLPARWREHGGVMLPMYQAEALWIAFGGGGGWTHHVPGAGGGYPFAVKVAAGKIDAVTGEAWRDGINRDPQDYLVLPDQPWLDGFAVEQGVIRQFVAMPLGEGYTVEEQLTGAAEHGGLQIVAYPLKASAWKRIRREHHRLLDSTVAFAVMESRADLDMGLAPGGRMTQHVYEDEHDFTDWDLRHRSRCFVHLLSAPAWSGVTGERPPTEPPTPEHYRRAGIPWFDYYDADRKALEGAERLQGVESVAERAKRLGQPETPGDDPVDVGPVIPLGPAPAGRRAPRSVVREM